MIPFKPRTGGIPRGSTVLALIFALIALTGVWSIFAPQDTALTGKPTSDAIQAESLTQPNYGEYILRIALVTVGLIIVLVVGARIAKRHSSAAQTADLGLRILGRRYITPKQFFMKVAIDDRLLLLGVSEQSINLITELSGSGDDDMSDSEETPVKQGFAAIFNRRARTEGL